MTELRVVEVVAESESLTEFDYGLIADPEARDWAESAAGFITFGLGQAVVKVLEAGNLLLEAKQRLKHGEYLPWVEQACGLKPQRAAELSRAASWVQSSGIAGHFESLADTQVLFLLSADATPEDVREWALERCAAGDPPTRKEVQERKRKAQGKPDRTLVQETLSVLKLSTEARQLAAKAEHISTRQLMDELGVEELPKGKEHKTAQFTFCKNGTGWWKLPIEQPVEVPATAPKPEPKPLREQAELLSVESEWETVSTEEAAQRMGFAKPHHLRNVLTPSFTAKRGLPARNGWEAARSDERGKCLIRKTI
jgi:hypothetical protein